MQEMIPLEVLLKSYPSHVANVTNNSRPYFGVEEEGLRGQEAWPQANDH